MAPAVEFHETLVQLLIGVLFVMIAASVTPGVGDRVLPGALALVAMLVFVIRPAMVALITLGSKLGAASGPSSAGWRRAGSWQARPRRHSGSSSPAQAPRGNRILPIVFVVIFGTVVVYGLSGAAVARSLGLPGPRARSC